jgi:NADPH oxidase
MGAWTLLKKQMTARKLLFHVVFWGVHWGLFAFGWYGLPCNVPPGKGRKADGNTRYKQASDPRLAGLNTLQYSVWLSRGAGLVLSVDGMLILVPVCRTIMRFFRPKIRFIPLDENIWFHRQLAYALLIFTIIHVSAHYVK